MDKLKENAFTYSLVGIGALFLVLLYVLILKPLASFSDTADALATTKRTIDLHLKKDPLPCPEYVEFRENQGEQDLDSFQEALDVFIVKAALFKRFFDEATVPPDSARFSARYRQGIEELQRKYRVKHSLPTEVGDDRRVRDESKLIPTVYLVPQQDIDQSGAERIPEAMKQYWIVEEIFAACDVLELGGLQGIDFPRKTVRARRARAKEKSIVDFEHVIAEVTINMRFREIEDFLARLYKGERVPFVEPEEISVTKDEEEFPKFLPLAREETPDKGVAADAARQDDNSAEPHVVVTFKLRALDFNGIPPEEETTEEESGR